MTLSPLTSLLNFIRQSRSPESLQRYMAVVELYMALQESLAGHDLEPIREAAFKSLEQINVEEVDEMVLYQRALSLKDTAVKHSLPLLTEKGRNAIDAFKARWAEAHERDRVRKKRFSDLFRRRPGASEQNPESKDKTIQIRVFVRMNDLGPTTQKEIQPKFSQSSRASLDSLLWRLNKKLIKDTAQLIIHQNPRFYRREELDELKSAFRRPPFYLRPLEFRQSFRRDVELVVCLDGYWQIWLDIEAPRRFCNVWKLENLYVLKGKHLRTLWLWYR
ncbi:hypothetical protein B0H19DRAFT_315010 [Mycena capillaripes]|nr:hypothetical protein B0H19DRAFT_315010 [Mycena capillaripes]